MIIEKHLMITDPTLSVVQTLKSSTELSSMQIKAAINKGCLWLQNGPKIKRLRRLKTELKLEQQLHFYYNSAVLEQHPLNARLLEDFEGYSIWYKPAGMLCQGSKWGDHTTINRYVEQHIQPQRKAIILHRLDKMTAGLIIIAHNKVTAKAFTQIFEHRKIKKCYQAIVEGEFLSAKEVVYDSEVNQKAALSRVNLISFDADTNQSILNVCIETGRKHQIRQHLAQAGFPIVGDRLYGKAENADNKILPDLQLLAYCLAFECPISGDPKAFQLADEFHLKHG